MTSMEQDGLTDIKHLSWIYIVEHTSTPEDHVNVKLGVST